MARAVRTGVLLAVVGGLAFPATDARACSCAVGPETQQERQLRQAEAVFTGRVTRVVDPRAGSAVRSSADPVVATIAVTDVSKGDLGSGPFNAGLCGGSERVAGDELPRSRALNGAPEAQVVTARFSASCGIEFREGQAWTVYAVRREEPVLATEPGTAEVAPDGDSAGWVLWTGLGAALGLVLAAALAVRRRRSGA
jgi:hypothetical protein